MKALGLWLALALSSVCCAQQATSFVVSFPGLRSNAPLSGRVILLLSRDFSREPRSHVEPNEPLDSPYLFGLNVTNLAPGTPAVLAPPWLMSITPALFSVVLPTMVRLAA